MWAAVVFGTVLGMAYRLTLFGLLSLMAALPSCSKGSTKGTVAPKTPPGPHSVNKALDLSTKAAKCPYSCTAATAYLARAFSGVDPDASGGADDIDRLYSDLNSAAAHAGTEIHKLALARHSRLAVRRPHMHPLAVFSRSPPLSSRIQPAGDFAVTVRCSADRAMLACAHKPAGCMDTLGGSNCS